MNKPQTCLDCGNAASFDLFGCWFCRKCADVHLETTTTLADLATTAAKMRLAMADSPTGDQLARRMFYQDGKLR